MVMFFLIDITVMFVIKYLEYYLRLFLFLFYDDGKIEV